MILSSPGNTLSASTRHGRRRTGRIATGRGRTASLLMIVAIMAAQMLLGGAGTAAAIDWNCKDAPTPEYPGAGWVGKIDPPSLGKGESGSVYDEYSYAGQVWHTYDTGCMGDPNATVDTWVGNKTFDVAKLLVGLTNATHWLQHSQGALQPIDNLVSVLTVELYDHAFTPWLGLVLVILVVGLLWWSLKGDLAQVGKRTLWLIAGLVFASATYLTPLTYTTIADELLTDGVGEIQEQILAGGDMSARDGLPTLLHKHVVYRNWLRGEFGSATSPEAKRFGRALLDAQACSKVETLKARQGQPCPVDQKKKKFTDIANQLQDTPVYGTFTGTDGTRTGVGVGAMIESFCYCLFQLLCQLALFLAKLIIRVIVLAGPIIGLVAILKNDLLPKVFGAVATAVSHGAVLAVASVIHLRIMAWLLDPARGLGYLAQLLITVLVTAVMWFALKPGRKFRNMMTTGLNLIGVETMPWEQLQQKRWMRRMRRNQQRHERQEERAHNQIYNTVMVANGNRPENDTNQQPRRVPSQRVYDPPQSGPAGALGATATRGDDGPAHFDDTAGTAPNAPGGGPRPPGNEPGGAGTAVVPAAPHAAPATARSTEGGSRAGVPKESSPSHPEQPANQGDRTTESPEPSSSSVPRQAAEPEVILPSEHRRGEQQWLNTERAEQNWGPRTPNPSRREGQQRVWNVYQPSSGRIVRDTGPTDPPSGPRPESQE